MREVEMEVKILSHLMFVFSTVKPADTTKLRFLDT